MLFLRQALWRPGWAPSGQGRILFLRDLRLRLAETASLADGFYLPWTDVQSFDGRLFLVSPGPTADTESTASWWPTLSTDERLHLADLLLRTAASFEERSVRLGPVRPECLQRAGGGWRLEDPIVAELAAPFRPGWPKFSRLNFLSPEEARGEKGGPAGDRFAMGATLYWLFTGRLPFDDDDDRYIIPRLFSQAPIDPRYYLPPLPGSAAEAILSLLAKERSRRPAPAALTDVLTPAAPHTTEQPHWCRRRAHPPVLARPREPRWPRRAAGLIGIACALIAATALLLRQPRQMPAPDLAQAARTVYRLYQARNDGDLSTLAALTSPGLDLGRVPPPPAAVWRAIISMGIFPGPRPGTARATVNLRESVFSRGVVRRWSGEERLSLVVRHGHWLVSGITRCEADRSGQRGE